MIRVFPGAVSSSSLRGLVLTDDASPAEAALWPKSGGSPISVALRDLRPSASGPLRQELARRRMHPYAFDARDLSPSTAYDLVARCGGSRGETLVATPPESIGPDGVTIAVASCFYGYYHKAGHYLRALKTPCRFARPLLKFLVGDNLYLDVGPNENRDEGWDHTVFRYLEYFWRSLYADVLGFLPTLTTWDDHELWNNYPESQTWLSRTWFSGRHRADYMAAGLECLALFQGTLNPPAVLPGAGSRSFQWDLPPLSFFFADLRSNRTLYDASHRTRHGAGGPRTMLPPGELAALEAWCRRLSGPGILVLGQPLWIEPGGRTDYNPAAFSEQYARIWEALAAAPHDVLVLSGDVHYSRAIEIRLGPRTVYEFVTSPACHIPTTTSVAWNAIWGTTGRQGRAKVSLRPGFPLDKGERYTALKPGRPRYLMGTDAPNTIALLHFTPAGDAVEVGAVMVDLETNGVAATRPAGLPGWFSGSEPPSHHCYAPRLLELK